MDHVDMAALLAAPDASTAVGRRDHAILIVALQQDCGRLNSSTFAAAIL